MVGDSFVNCPEKIDYCEKNHPRFFFPVLSVKISDKEYLGNNVDLIKRSGWEPIKDLSKFIAGGGSVRGFYGITWF